MWKNRNHDPNPVGGMFPAFGSHKDFSDCRKNCGAQVSLRRLFLGLSIAMVLCQVVFAVPAAVIPVGRTVGIHLQTGVTVTEVEPGSAAHRCGLKKGDCITHAADTPLPGKDALCQLIAQTHGKPLPLQVDRCGKAMQLMITPQPSENGFRLGIRVRDGMNGIGTVTFFDPQTGAYGALGHGISAPGSETPLSMATGSVLSARITNIIRGSAGVPGKLEGSCDPNTEIGVVLANTACGIFGKMERRYADRAAIPAAAAEQAHTGAAEILCNISGTQVESFSVEVLEIHPDDPDGHHFLLRVTDPALLAQTGGIVQGMSGSPILQDGRLIGAVTHVLVDDPAKGYGIFLQSMLQAADRIG